MTKRAQECKTRNSKKLAIASVHDGSVVPDLRIVWCGLIVASDGILKRINLLSNEDFCLREKGLLVASFTDF